MLVLFCAHSSAYTTAMVKRALLYAFAISAPMAFGQLDSNSVTVTATRNTAVQPDQAIVAVFVDTPVNTSLSDVLAAVEGSGIAAPNFAGVSTVQYQFTPTEQPAPALEWTFALPTPVAKLKDVLATLSDVQKRVTQQNNGMKLDFSVQGTQVSQQAQQSQTCSVPDLLSDARAQAQKLGAAAGLVVGSILAMSSSTVTTASSGVAVPGMIISRYSSSSGISIPSVCSLTVKFALGRF